MFRFLLTVKTQTLSVAARGVWTGTCPVTVLLALSPHGYYVDCHLFLKTEVKGHVCQDVYPTSSLKAMFF